MITLPIPDPNARTAALLSGQVDWIEAPAPDAIPRLVERGMVISSNLYPHVWSWHLSRVDGSPWNDLRVRKAANLAVDRTGILSLLGGYALEAKGHVSPGDPWFGSPSFDLTYDPEAAKALLAEAGHGPDNPVKVKMDRLLRNASLAFDPKERDGWLAQVHTREVDNALFLWVVHDVAPRAMTKNVQGFVQARNWFQSLTPVYMQ